MVACVVNCKSTIAMANTKRESIIENRMRLTEDDKNMPIAFAAIPVASLIAMPFTSVWLPIVINGVLLTIVGSIALTHYIKGSSFRQSLLKALRSVDGFFERFGDILRF